MGKGDEKARDIVLTGIVTAVSDELFWCWLAGEGLAGEGLGNLNHIHPQQHVHAPLVPLCNMLMKTIL